MNTIEIAKEQKSAAQYIKVTGILSIVFGAIGTLLGFLAILFGTSEEPVGFDIVIFLLWVLPHIFFTISGIYLVHMPKRSLTQGLIITTLIIGAIWNLILLAFAIISLTQMSHYISTAKRSK